MAKEFDPGFLTKVEVWPPDAHTFYFLLSGVSARTNQVRQLVTRGKGRENAATRIPIRVRTLDNRHAREIVAARFGMFPLLQTLHQQGHFTQLADLEVVLMVMPRDGNKISGWEINAPGGTADPGESREQVGDREYDEEAPGLRAITLGNPFPSWFQFASGIYDEVQAITFAIAYGRLGALPEGAREWLTVGLDKIEDYIREQNHIPIQPLVDDFRESFTPVDGKVAMALMWLVEKLKNDFHLK